MTHDPDCAQDMPPDECMCGGSFRVFDSAEATPEPLTREEIERASAQIADEVTRIEIEHRTREMRMSPGIFVPHYPRDELTWRGWFS